MPLFQLLFFKVPVKLSFFFSDVCIDLCNYHAMQSRFKNNINILIGSAKSKGCIGIQCRQGESQLPTLLTAVNSWCIRLLLCFYLGNTGFVFVFYISRIIPSSFFCDLLFLTYP